MHFADKDFMMTNENIFNFPFSISLFQFLFNLRVTDAKANMRFNIRNKVIE